VISGPLAVGAIAFAVSLLMVPLTNKLAFRFGAVVHPRADRWSRQVVPILGGLAVAIAVGAVAWLAIDEGTTLAMPGWRVSSALTAIGLMDDLLGRAPALSLCWPRRCWAPAFLVVVFDDFSLPAQTRNRPRRRHRDPDDDKCHEPGRQLGWTGELTVRGDRPDHCSDGGRGGNEGQRGRPGSGGHRRVPGLP
jgi:UDP-N-acetylmuramyl pentapeptide phosphotransferase/UDP-N-acetylglucosamine-1-phosphate transferase